VTNYAIGRALRILPAYWVALVLCIFIPVLADALPDAAAARGPQWWHYFGLVEVYWPGNALGGLPHAWTLACEMAFYVLLPLLAIAAGRWLGDGERRLRGELVLLALATVVAAILRHLAIFGGDPSYASVPEMPIGTLPYFLTGTLLATWTVVRPGARLLRTLGRRGDGIVLAIVAVLVAVSVAGILKRQTDPVTPASWTLEFLFNGVVAGLVVATAIALPHDARSAWARLLRLPVVRGLGAISLGVYLWHFPVLFALTDRGTATWLGGDARFLALLLPTVALSVLPGLASYRFIERPLLRWRRARVPA
jgi:peptidoglycan/LPS O-acetylase OafA/YrhL